MINFFTLNILFAIKLFSPVSIISILFFLNSKLFVKYFFIIPPLYPTGRIKWLKELRIKNFIMYHIIGFPWTFKSVLGNFLPIDGRGKKCRISRYKVNFNIIDESYNANPLSMKNAIENLSKLNVEKSKKYVLIGDMLELGKKSVFYHKNLSKIINKTDIDKVFVYGKNILETYKHLTKDKRGNILQNKNDFDLIFSNTIKKNDYLMIKGSNSTGLNKLVNNCIKGLNNVI